MNLGQSNLTVCLQVNYKPHIKREVSVNNVCLQKMVSITGLIFRVLQEMTLTTYLSDPLWFELKTIV